MKTKKENSKNLPKNDDGTDLRRLPQQPAHVHQFLLLDELHGNEHGLQVLGHIQGGVEGAWKDFGCHHGLFSGSQLLYDQKISIF